MGRRVAPGNELFPRVSEPRPGDDKLSGHRVFLARDKLVSLVSKQFAHSTTVSM